MEETNPYRHPTREQVLEIFGVTWQQANLHQRKNLLTRIEALDEKEGRWLSLLNQAGPNERWFITDRLHFLGINREQLNKQHNYLKAVYRDRSQAEEKGEEYKTVEYDKDRIREIPITRILTMFGHNPQIKSHDNVFYNCMFHNEKTPSFCVTPSKNLYHCHGCHAGGDVFNLYQHLAGCSFPQTLKELNNLI
jgi:hypothetical protein